MSTTITRPSIEWRATASRERQRPDTQKVDWSKVEQAARAFGVKTFRPGQRELIEAVLQHRDALGILPTGGGKSLCYQLPALLLPKPTVIVTPLLALAQDQPDHLTSWRLESSRLDSSLSAQETRDNEAEIATGISPLIYVTPERLQTEDCIALLRRNGIGRLVIDEAHCISDWGHDFRPAYLAIARAAERLGRPPILAVTATATKETADDITEQLALRDPVVVRPGLARPNLAFEVIRTVNEDRKRDALAKILARHDGKSGIIYCATIALAEEVHTWLGGPGAQCVSAGIYHGKLPMAAREDTQERFMRGDLRVMVATKAFGLGIDKRDVRFVVHWTFPDSLETYYQEAGRAGRDGEPATAYLLYRLEDRRIQTYFLGTRYPRPEECQRLCTTLPAASVNERVGGSIKELALTTKIPERRLRVLLTHLEREGIATIADDKITVADARATARTIAAVLASYAHRRKRDRERLQAMMHYAQSPQCRVAQVLRYFGETPPTPNCGTCDVCRERGAS
jgi:ATP-dependent DNA helicase RecQ